MSNDTDKLWQERLKTGIVLSAEEVPQIAQDFLWLSAETVGWLDTHVDLLLISLLHGTKHAIEKMDCSTQSLTRWLMYLTVGLVIPTAVIACFTILLAAKH
jgi:hypothetical protein